MACATSRKGWTLTRRLSYTWSMTTTETRTGTCRRCHGSGREPQRHAYPPRQEALLARLEDLGAQRAELYRARAYMSATGRPEYDQVLAQIRKILESEPAATIRVSDLAQALRVSSAAYYKILNGQTGS